MTKVNRKRLAPEGMRVFNGRHAERAKPEDDWVTTIFTVGVGTDYTLKEKEAAPWLPTAGRRQRPSCCQIRPTTGR